MTVWEKNIKDKGSSKFKGSEIDVCLAGLGNNKKVNVPALSQSCVAEDEIKEIGKDKRYGPQCLHFVFCNSPSNALQLDFLLVVKSNGHFQS